MFKYINPPKGWFYSDTFNYWQKTNGRVVAYVSQLIFGYQVQLYMRGKLGFCELEARTNDASPDGYNKMFELGDSWLEFYHEGVLEEIHNNPFSISNPEGVWIKNVHEKKYWI